MRPIDTLETGPGASSFLRTADGAQRRNDYSLHYKWLKQSLGPAEATELGDPVQIGLKKPHLRLLLSNVSLA